MGWRSPTNVSRASSHPSTAASVDVESKVSQAVRKQAAKFIEWLDESDDEDSD